MTDPSDQTSDAPLNTPTALDMLTARYRRMKAIRDEARRFLEGPVREHLRDVAGYGTWVCVPLPNGTTQYEALFVSHCQELLKSHGYQSVDLQARALRLVWA